MNAPQLSVLEKLDAKVELIVNGVKSYRVSNSFTSFDMLLRLKEGTQFSIYNLGKFKFESASYSKVSNTLTVWLIGVVDRGHKFY